MWLGHAPAAATRYPTRAAPQPPAHTCAHHTTLRSRSPLPVPPPRRIIGSIFWLIGSFIHLFASLGQALAVAVNGVRPSPAKWLIFGAVMQLIGTLLILIGSCVVGGSTLSSVSAGAILMFIGFSMWALNVLIALGVNWTVASMAAAFPLPRQRQYAWSAFTSTMFLLVQTLLYVVGSVALIVRDPAGLWLAAGLYFLVGSIYGTWGWMGQMRGGFGYYTPVMGLMNAGLVGTGAGVGAGVATGAATGAVAGAGTAAAVHHHEQQHAGMGMGAAPGATGMGAGPGMMKSGSGLGSGVGSGVGPGMAGAGPGTATTATAAPAARVV